MTTPSNPPADEEGRSDRTDDEATAAEIRPAGTGPEPVAAERPAAPYDQPADRPGSGDLPAGSRPVDEPTRVTTPAEQRVATGPTAGTGPTARTGPTAARPTTTTSSVTPVAPSVAAGTGADTDPAQTSVGPADHRAMVSRQKQRFGGMKFGASFFGWLTATGTAVILTAVLAAIGAALGMQGAVNLNQAGENPAAVGLVGVIVLLAIVFVAYFAGGYVAGRMARFSGAKQGIGVWLWAIIIAIVVAILTWIAGSQIAGTGLNGIPRIPVGNSTSTLSAILLALAVLAVSLVGAVLGGLAGMRFHRRVDRADLETPIA